ncbi:hypothetical protein [Volucribacter amazonae]|uniref:GIY-YIG domain-containing protein n=1 Tax=Volucribacter amazonae TaxID=256731 RepID=A0A9X4SJP6_9PAST|nr:hypothetical protein [Volucribacter amazonae]MDG6894344.1 hypothetical protein [Volucribacter amazonae]
MWDPLGLVNELTQGYSVYGLFENNKTKPHYIGITNNIPIRENQHIKSGRLPKNSKLIPLDSNINYGNARGYEQAYIEYYGTKTVRRGENISGANKGNKNNSFSTENKTRNIKRQNHFMNVYNEKLQTLSSQNINGRKC